MTGGMNLYAYCLNNPVMYSDEFGQMPEWAKWIVGGLAVAGLVVATVLTCGVAGAGAATVGAAMLTGGIVSGGINAIDQLSDGVEFDFMELAKVTTKGQITIPKAIREKLDLREGSKIIFLQRGNDIIIKNLSKHPVPGEKRPERELFALERQPRPLAKRRIHRAVTNPLTRRRAISH